MCIELTVLHVKTRLFRFLGDLYGNDAGVYEY